jgi:hypothetical protein
MGCGAAAGADLGITTDAYQDASPSLPDSGNTCRDGIRDGNETDVDCGGGTCRRCADGKQCQQSSDCLGQCIGGVCEFGYCFDRMLDGDESDVDCGGHCSPCPIGRKCHVTSDCAAGAVWPVICASGVCVDECSDGVKDGSETDVDCGGGQCPRCPDGMHCQSTSDCVGLCIQGTCALRHCTDGVLDGDESDIDCGGSCPGCPLGKGCHLTSDCAPNQINGPAVCAAGRCAAECFDGLKDGNETDVDCGGSCIPCSPGQMCLADSGCLARDAFFGGPDLCINGVCTLRCRDGVRDGDETGIDCGGSCVSQNTPPGQTTGLCYGGEHCNYGGDCAYTITCQLGSQGQELSCIGGLCTSPCSDGVLDYAETDVDCGNTCGYCPCIDQFTNENRAPACPPCADGKRCVRGSDCASGTCMNGVCAPAPPDLGVTD